MILPEKNLGMILPEKIHGEILLRILVRILEKSCQEKNLNEFLARFWQDLAKISPFCSLERIYHQLETFSHAIMNNSTFVSTSCHWPFG